MNTENNSLMSLVAHSQYIEQELIKSGGELTPDLESFFAEVSSNLAKKLDAYDYVMEQLELQEKYWKEKAELFLKQSKFRKNFRERLKDTIKIAMELKGITELQGDDVRYVLSDSKPALEINESELPRDYWKQVSTETVNKDLIKIRLEEGKTIEGVSLRPVKTLRTYAKRRNEK